MVAGHISIRYGLTGVNYAIVSACSTGAHCIGQAARTIERGEQDIIIAGGSEFSTSPMGIGGFAAAKALSTEMKVQRKQVDRGMLTGTALYSVKGQGY